jgi:heme-degrading monooxygenase HmoA
VSHVVINAITVPADQADELAARFAGRAGMVEKADGFESFDLLRPLGGRDQWLVVTRWKDEESFQAWMSSASFGKGHGSASPGVAPVASASEVWSFSVEQSVRA